MRALVLAGALGLALVDCGRAAAPTGTPGALAVTAADFGDAWPLAVPAGVLRCERMGVWFEAGGTRYAVNGVALSSRGAVDVLAIQAPDPTTPGARKSVGPLIDRGLQLCGPSVGVTVHPATPTR